MSILYRVLRRTLRHALDLYFVDIQSSGQENIPKAWPVIFAANHPNSIMDTVLLGTQTRRQIHYMARSGLFSNPLVSALFNQCGVIPIYRSQDSATGEKGEESGRNQSSFERAYQVLEEGGCIGIFPEGQNSLERKVREIKTGTARIALETEARNGFALGVHIVPVGLNFEDRDRFLSGVLLRFGAPIDVRGYADAHDQDPREAVRALTERIQRDIRQLATHIEDDRHQRLVKDIHRIYGRELLTELIGDIDIDLRGVRRKLADELRSAPGPKPSLDDRFVIQQHIADAVAYYQKVDPVLVARVRMDICRYQDHMRQVRMHHDFQRRPPETLSSRKDALKFTTFALFFGPIAAWGFINNVVPYLITRWQARRAPDEAMRAITAFVTAMLAFPLFYALQGWVVWQADERTILWMLFYLLSLPPAGFFFLRYRRQLVRYRDRILSRTMFRTRRNLVRQLDRERQNLLNTFDELKEKYMEAERLRLLEARATNPTGPTEAISPETMI